MPLCFLPSAVLRLVASFLSPAEVLDKLLLAYPSCFPELRNGVAWDHLDDRNALENARHLALASCDAVKRLRVNYKPPGGRLVTKWRRVVKGKRLKTLVIEDPELVRGERLSLSVDELHFDVTDPCVDRDVVNARNWWEEYQPASPAPVIESVVVECDYKDLPIDEYGPENVVMLGSTFKRGDSFFKAFPHAKKLSFDPEPLDGFFNQPANVLANVREMVVAHNETHNEILGFGVVDSVFPYLDRFENLEVLILRDEEEYLTMLPQEYVHKSLHTLNFVSLYGLLFCDNVWDAIPRQFPRLRTLSCKTPDSHPMDMVEPSFLADLFPKQLAHLENLELINVDVPLDEFLDMVSFMLRKSPATIRSVVCQGWRNDELVPTPAQLEKLEKLRKVPSHRVEFRVLRNESSYGRVTGGFYFAFSRP